eukprot:TRINITY_DN7431_c0_g1_i1.p2 TRINITY_DN7431_c0_g1~~TRINITY_DN7431_c0_g1_i1.p2  ORF type:complete len:102 (-),score=12.47 TRINITY_DN7431_c0_g1_i1:958-1263(-)
MASISHEGRPFLQFLADSASHVTQADPDPDPRLALDSSKQSSTKQEIRSPLKHIDFPAAAQMGSTSYTRTAQNSRLRPSRWGHPTAHLHIIIHGEMWFSRS